MENFDIKIDEIIYIYQQEYTVPWEMPERIFMRHPDPQLKAHSLFIVESGDTHCRLCGNEFDFHTGDVLWIIPNNLYSGHSLTIPFRYICINFTTWGEFNLFDFDICEPVFRNNDYTELLFSLFRSAFHSFIEKRPEHILEIKSTLLKIISILLSLKLNQLQHKFIPDVIRPGVNYINAHYLEKTINISDLAKLCHISAKHFSRVFTTGYHESAKQYINKLKINHAKNLLETSALSIAEIGEKTGFTDIYYFSRVFKNLEGISPYDYRKKMKNFLNVF